MEEFIKWITKDYPLISDSSIKNPRSYALGIKNFGEEQNIPNIFKMTSESLNDYLLHLDSNMRFEKNHRTHLRRFTEFKDLDPNQYRIFDRQISEKKAKKTENIAVDDITKHFEKLNYTVKNVSKLNLGWDLEVENPSEKLLLEVKGLFGKFYTVRISENEYAKMRDSEHFENYRICIVSNCKSSKSKREILIVRLKDNKFISDKNVEIGTCTESLSASIVRLK